MTREEELEILMLEVLSKTRMSLINYRMSSSTFRGWIEEVNQLYEEYQIISNESQTY